MFNAALGKMSPELVEFFSAHPMVYSFSEAVDQSSYFASFSLFNPVRLMYLGTCLTRRNVTDMPYPISDNHELIADTRSYNIFELEENLRDGAEYCYCEFCKKRIVKAVLQGWSLFPLDKPNKISRFIEKYRENLEGYEK